MLGVLLLSAAMRILRFVPFAFLSGAHGFALFAPYALVMMSVFHVMHRRRRMLANPVVTTATLPAFAELDAESQTVPV